MKKTVILFVVGLVLCACSNDSREKKSEKNKIKKQLVIVKQKQKN
jgi:Tfp pilus assembly protein PilF